jgi:CubicO group peptidase (beta-lactamase class C family)
MKTRMTDERVIEDLRDFMLALVQKDEFSGAVLVARDGEVLFKQAYGLASVAWGIPNQTDTRFNLGSMNKMFTAVAILQLAQAGKLDLHAPFGQYLSNYAKPSIANKVTIHHLLTHTGGLGDIFDQAYEITSKDRFLRPADYLPLFDEKELLFEPGTSWSYSNAGFILLGLIIEAVSGQNYFEYIRRHIYQPAGMENSDSYDLRYDTPNLANGYTQMVPGGGKRMNNLFMHVVKGSPAGGGYSTVEDLLHFDIALRNHRLLNANYTEKLWGGKIAVENEDQKYSYGFHEQIVDGQRVVGHGGGFMGINSDLAMYLDSGITVAVMSNYDPPAASRVATHLIKRFHGIPLPEPVEVSNQALEHCTGKFNLPPTRGHKMPALVLQIEEGQLVGRVGMNPPMRLLPLSEREFFQEDSIDLRLRLVEDDAGTVQGVHISGSGPEIAASKIV